MPEAAAVGRPRVAVITGAARGIGAAIADRLAQAEHHVAVVDIDGDAADETARSIQDRHRVAAIGIGADVADSDCVRRAFDQLRAELGPVSVLVNNAGVISAAPFLQLREAEWDRIMKINSKSQFLCAQAALPDMLAHGWGRIVNIASDAAKTAEPFIAHYSASKFAVVGLTQSIALEYAATGVTANAICPAITATTMMTHLADELAAAAPDRDDSGWRSEMVREIPLGRAMSTDDIAATCLFLVSDEAAAISGQAINASGAHEVH